MQRLVHDLAYGLVNCGGKRTLTGMLSGSGNQFCDWTAAYRMFSKQRFDPQDLLDVSLRHGVSLAPDNAPVIAHIDDTLLKKTGRKVHGAKWQRDPLGPAFHTNFIWAQRFVQASIACPASSQLCQARSIPVSFVHAPMPVKPGRNADQLQKDAYKEAKKKSRISCVGAKLVGSLRQRLNELGSASRHLLVSFDGGYTNREVIQNLPAHTTFIGRVRKDAKIYDPPADQPDTGRRRLYGEPKLTPDQIRTSDQVSWQKVKAFAAGKEHEFKLKVVENVKWKPAGGHQLLKLIIISPLGYRLAKGANLLYRKPAFLITNDLKLPLQTLLQAYVWRWEIEVNFREQKTLMGCGQAQVRNQHSAEGVPKFVTAVYSLLLLAAEHCSRQNDPPVQMLQRAKWYPEKENSRWTTGDICNRFRAEYYSKAIGVSFDGFMNKRYRKQNHLKLLNPALSAMISIRT
ncbi:DDE superfamily endonuclease [Cyclonatronum proteinivorum]|uniref:DDE superfamily endonuclease n=3 Tax=Cyclonatronum proteinivorum TaxID=1457365 RepID=A0A345UGC0_9BACT|nr:transposase [Cyclonatronum proteinivorum]AXI99521.1 DDE superfamily endonuclease [Cyclonatronum proteinivorum]AXJ02090.1 DDE superfamily endonuclease [Cyclonatronum proteinivorum]